MKGSEYVSHERGCVVGVGGKGCKCAEEVDKRFAVRFFQGDIYDLGEFTEQVVILIVS